MSPEDEADLRRLILVEYRLSQRTAAACVGKEPFDSLALARKVVERMRKNHGSDRIGEPDRCAYCGKYHIHSKAIRRRPHVRDR